ncbi:MAG: mannosyltransferase family protein [Chloroflexota bacterium]
MTGVATPSLTIGGRLRAIAAPTLVTRGLALVAAALALALLPLSPWAPAGKAVPGLIGALSRWDANHYVTIARDGYPAGTDEIAFSPLYPLAIRLVHALIGRLPMEVDAYRVAAVLVANAAMVAAVLLLAELARGEGGERGAGGEGFAGRATWALLVFPTSVFLSVAYSESLFLALTIGVAVALRRDRWILAGGLGALAALSRPQGVLIVALIAAEALAGRDRLHDRRAWLHAAIAVVLPGLALLGWMAWQAAMLGDPLAFVHVQGGWARGLVLPWDTFLRFFGGPLTVHSGLHSLVDLAFTLGAAALVVAAWRTERWPLAAYATLLLIVPLCTGTLLSMPRFALGIFPIFLVLGRLMARPSTERAVLVAGSGGLALAAALFTGYFWVS